MEGTLYTGEIPVLFIHSGNQEYLTYAIRQAERTNKRVFLLGDESNKNVTQNWVDMNRYITNRWGTFEKVYQHMSTNPYTFELNCFRRFFASYEFAKANGIQSFMMLDSDCLAFADFSKLDFNGVDVGLSMPQNQENYCWTASPHASFWTLQALEDFLQYLFYKYTKDSEDLEVKWEYHQRNKIRGGICDMTLLYLWAVSNRGFNVLNTTKSLQGGVFDHFLSVTEGYEIGEFPVNKFCGIKHLCFKDGRAYFRKKSGEWIQTYTIHAQGKSKIYIKELYKQRNSILFYVIVKIKNIIARAFQKVRILQ